MGKKAGPFQWLDLISMVLEILKSKNVVAIIALLLLIFYVFPLLVVGGLSWDSTNRLESAIGRSADRIEHAVDRLKDVRTAIVDEK